MKKGQLSILSVFCLCVVAISVVQLKPACACIILPNGSSTCPDDLILPTGSQTGFYRQQDRPEVYLVYRPGFYCHVQNENQMGAFGGFGKVQVVNSLNLNGTKTGGCGWPNGFFKRSNKPEVYRMYGGGIPEFNIGDSFCHVANEAQMNAYGGFGQVRGVSPSSDLGRGRQFTGKCPNP